MKKRILVFLILLQISTSCSKNFLNIGEGNTINNIELNLKNTYFNFASPDFFGRNIITIGEFASDNAVNKSFNDIQPFYNYSIRTDNSTLLDTWMRGYRVYHNSTCIISDIEKMKVDASESTKSKLESMEAQSYSLRALTNYYMVNSFGFPYSFNPNSNLGLVKVNDCESSDNYRSTVYETYNTIIEDIDLAIKLFDESEESLTPYALNKDAMLVLKSRVYMHLEKYDEVVEFTSEIINSSYQLVGSESAYFSMWGSSSLGFEDIFVLGKDYQSYNYSTSLNTLFGVDKTEMSKTLKNTFSENDYRLKVLNFKSGQGYPGKYRGTIENKQVYNVPVFRLSEVYLLAAEAKAQLGDASAIDDLYEIAKRNVDLVITDIPTDKDGLLNFISEERRRELYQEGHRWFDMRRTGEIMSDRNDLDGGSFDVQKFVYPIPLYEINASGIQQNDWLPGLPNQN